MDLKTFAEDDFDPKKWINRAWSTSGNQEKEVFVANTVSRLQLYMKQLTNSLDETTTQIVNSIPRTLQDAAALQLEGAMLQQQLLALEDKVEGVERQTGHSILSLQRIDQLKSRLENAASALREADKWAVLAAALEAGVEGAPPEHPDQLRALGGQVAALTASLEVLTEAPDYEAKRLQLEALYNRLEASLHAPCLQALNQKDRELTSCYIAIFVGMGRSAAGARCWRLAAAAALAQRWARSERPSLAALLPITAPADHVDWLVNVLKTETPMAELVQLYTELLQTLDPTPTKVVSASLKLCSDPNEGIVILTNLRQDIDAFLQCIRSVIEDNSKEVVPKRTLRELGKCAYAPLRELLPKYTDFQKTLLLAYLDDPQLKQEDILEQSRAILSVAERCSDWLAAARARAVKIAGDAAGPHYAPAVEAFFSALSNLISAHSRRIESAFLSGGGGVLSAACPAALCLQRAAAAALTAATEAPPDITASAPHPLSDLPALLSEGGAARGRGAAPGGGPAPPGGGPAPPGGGPAPPGGGPAPPGGGPAPPGGGPAPRAAGALRRASDQLRALARAVVRSPIDTQLDKIPSLDVWSHNDELSTDLPDFALSPQEYITEIGQYLMTLPQHLEMHLSEKQAPWQFLSEICTHTCEVYAERVLSIRAMDALGTKRCLTDIVYLSSVVEDLGTNVTPALKNLERSLRTAAPTQ